MNIKAITESTFQHHGATDLASFDAHPDQDSAAPELYKVLRTSTMADVVKTLAADIGQDPRRLRLWIMVNRQNKTIRPDQPIMDLRPTVEETYSRASAQRDQALRLWVEVAEEVNEDGEALWPTYQGQTNGVIVKNDLILLFLKWFDIEAQALRGVGHVYISKEKKVEDLVPIINKKMGWGEKLPGDEKVMLWEVRTLETFFSPPLSPTPFPYPFPLPPIRGAFSSLPFQKKESEISFFFFPVLTTKCRKSNQT